MVAFPALIVLGAAPRDNPEVTANGLGLTVFFVIAEGLLIACLFVMFTKMWKL